jgi:hypothetical protein
MQFNSNRHVLKRVKLLMQFYLKTYSESKISRLKSQENYVVQNVCLGFQARNLRS